MEKQDVRSITPEALEQLRRQAIRMHQKRMKYVEIAEILSVHRNTVSDWCRAYEKHGKKPSSQKLAASNTAPIEH